MKDYLLQLIHNSQRSSYLLSAIEIIVTADRLFSFEHSMISRSVNKIVAGLRFDLESCIYGAAM